MSVIKDLIENPHPINKTYANYWNLLLNSYEGGVDYSNSLITKSSSQSSILGNIFNIFVNGQVLDTVSLNGNLFRHKKETNESYANRIQQSYYYNYCSPIIDIYTNHLFKEPVNEDFESIESDVQSVAEDIDSRGSSISEFRKHIAELAQIYGHIYIITDSPNIQDGVITRQDQINKRAFPYFCEYAPQDVINWSLDSLGNANWVLLRECLDNNPDPFSFDKTKTHEVYYRLWTRTEWYLYDCEYNLVSEGVHGLGVVPITCIFDRKSKKAKNFLGISSLADIAFIARDIYNSCSELKQILRDQTFAFLALQGSRDEYSELTVGTGIGLLYPEGRAMPAYVSPPSANAETYFTHIDRQIAKIYQLAKLESNGLSGQVKSPVQDSQSGVSKAWDFNQTNSALAQKAANLEDGEMKMWANFALWQNKEFDGSVQYPNEFSAQSLMDDLNEAEKTSRMMLGETFDLEVKKAIQKKKFPRASEEDLDKMEEEAKALTGKNQNGVADNLVNRFLQGRTAFNGGNKENQNGN